MQTLRFKYHLSTLIVIATASSFLLMANLRSNFHAGSTGGEERRGVPFSYSIREFEYLPETAPKSAIDKALEANSRRFLVKGIGVVYPSIWGFKLNIVAIVGNILSGILFLLALGFLLERVIQKKFSS